MVKIIAETGSAHCKSYARCIALINAARKAGADAIKFSAFKPEEMTLNSNEPPFFIDKGPWAGSSLYSLYEKIALPYEWLKDLKKASIAAGLEFILSIYHPNTIPLLRELGVRIIKISSFELNYIELLKELAKETYIKKIILSTGGGTEDEIKTAIEILKEKDITLLYCVSSYPCKEEELNLKTLEDMKKFKVPVGFSNHYPFLSSAVIAVALGATVIESHIKLDNENPDASFSMFPDKFAAMIDACRHTEIKLGEVNYNLPKTYHRKEIEGQMLRVVW